jgi:hypothetical protein
MNVLAKTKKHFPSPVQDLVTKIYSRHPKFKSFMKSWNQILCSTSLKDYNTNLAKFEAENPLLAVKYCVDTWLILWKEKLVSFWVNQTLHFGVIVTSPIKGCHATLKSYCYDHMLLVEAWGRRTWRDAIGWSELRVTKGSRNRSRRIALATRSNAIHPTI